MDVEMEQVSDVTFTFKDVHVPNITLPPSVTSVDPFLKYYYSGRY